MTLPIWDQNHPDYRQRVRIRVEEQTLDLLIELLKTERSMLISERIATRDGGNPEEGELARIRRRSRSVERLLKEALRARDEFEEDSGS